MDIQTFAQHVKNRKFNIDTLREGICYLYGMEDKKPFVVKSSYYKKCDGIKIYRGLDCTEEMFNDYVEKFAFGEMFFINRLSVLGQGYYFADKKFVAKFYTNKTKHGLFKSPIISAKIMPDARLITKNQLNAEFRRSLSEVKQTLFAKFDGLLTEEDIDFLVELINVYAEPLVKAIILGYDGLMSPYTDKKGCIYLIFNRGKLLMSETEIQSVKNEVEPYIQLD